MKTVLIVTPPDGYPFLFSAKAGVPVMVSSEDGLAKLKSAIPDDRLRKIIPLGSIIQVVDLDIVPKETFATQIIWSPVTTEVPEHVPDPAPQIESPESNNPA